nr:hypothetical protein [uncultured Treponema sp.]
MTDLLLSELLALLLVVPALLRPFSKNLKRGSAIPILPFLSLFVCICIIIGQGIVLFLFVLCLFVLIVCLSEVLRLTAFFEGVLNDFYGIASIILRITLLILFGGVAYLVFRFAPEPGIKTEHQLTVRPIELSDAAVQHDEASQIPIEGLLIEREGGADKKALVIVAEAFPATGRPGAVAAFIADKGYTVLEMTRLNPPPLIPRADLYGQLLHLVGKKEQRYVAKETDPQTAARFSAFVKKAIARYGVRKRLFLYAEGMYTDRAAQFCAENQGAFTGVFFCLSDEEPLPQMHAGWAHIVREDARGAHPASASVHLPDATSTAEADLSDGALSATAAHRTATDKAASVADIPVASNPVAATPLPFCCYIRPYTELPGFGSLRAEDIFAAELLGSGRSIGRQDKAAAAAAFDRYAVLF